MSLSTYAQIIWANEVVLYEFFIYKLEMKYAFPNNKQGLRKEKAEQELNPEANRSS